MFYILFFTKILITFAFNDAYFYNSDNLRGIQMGYEGLSNEERAQLNEEYDRRDGERMGVRCTKWFSTNYNEEYKCLVAENRSLISSPLTLLVLGNSWAQNLMRIVQNECQDVFSSMYISATGACEPLYRTIYPGYDCTIDGIFQTAARQFKPDVVFIFTRHITGLEISNGTNPFDDDNFATAVRRLQALETVVKKKIFILDAFPLVQRRITQILKDYLRAGRPFKDSDIVDFGSGYLIAKQRMDRLAQICSKCEIFDFANQFYFNGEFKVYDPKFYMAFLGEGLHPTPAAWERVRPQINHICHHLNLGK